jgi:hypothetical protein
MRAPKPILVSEYCEKLEQVVLIEIGKTIKNKIGQVYSKKQIFSQEVSTKSGVISFKSITNHSLISFGKAPNFLAVYTSIPEELVCESYLIDFEKEKLKISRDVENSILTKDSDKLYHLIQDNSCSENSRNAGRLCELISIKDLTRNDFSVVDSNNYFKTESSRSFEVDLVLSGENNLCQNLTNYLRNKNHLKIII